MGVSFLNCLSSVSKLFVSLSVWANSAMAARYRSLVSLEIHWCIKIAGREKKQRLLTGAEIESLSFHLFYICNLNF